MISDAEHLLMCLLATFMSSLKKMSIQVLCQFFNQVYFLFTYFYLIHILLWKQKIKKKNKKPALAQWRYPI